MAFTTVHQADAIRSLEREYGRANFVRIEHTAEPYGVVWMCWLPSNVQPEYPRNLFIRPDGTRLSWTSARGEE